MLEFIYHSWLVVAPATVVSELHCSRARKEIAKKIQKIRGLICTPLPNPVTMLCPSITNAEEVAEFHQLNHENL